MFQSEGLQLGRFPGNGERFAGFHEDRHITPDRKFDPHAMVASLAGVVIVQLLSQRKRLPADDRVFSGRITGAASEDLVGDQIFVQFGRIAVDRGFAHEAQKLRVAIRA